MNRSTKSGFIKKRKMMIIIWYLILLFLLFFGVKLSKKGTWNDENMSLEQTKCFLGFCAVIVVLHHTAQATCASWLDPRYIRHGLDIFLTAGYPMVAIFFLCSGYGLYKSAKTKPDFFKRFIPARIIPILTPMILTILVFVGFRIWRKIPLTIDSPFAVNGHELWHPNGWYIPAIIVMYILFYIGFGLFRKDWIGILVVSLGIAGYIGYCIIFRYGTWWFNTPHMFLIGILLAKYEDRFFESCKKLYPLRLIITIILCVILRYLGDSGGMIYLSVFHLQYNHETAYKADLFGCIFQILYTLTFASLYYLLSMKMRIGNPMLSFLGKITLELYLVHGIFLNMFGYFMIYNGVKPVYYIENVSLYILVIFALAIPLAYVLSLFDKKLGKLLKGKPV